LYVSGAAKHAIASSKKSITVLGGDIIVTSAVSDGFHAEVGFVQSGGSLNITASGDGIDAGSGTAVISGGNINIYNQVRPHASCNMLTPMEAEMHRGKLKKCWRKRKHERKKIKAIFSQT
ncbi:MAG: hypothetical protein EZS26_004069, partial [Candidatus Ordinivivax streblomastigis]